MPVRLAGALRKEFTLILRDRHGLALLFILPLAFILVMSVALQDRFEANAGTAIGVQLFDMDDSDASREIILRLDAIPAFAVAAETRDTAPAIEEIAARFTDDDLRFAVVLPEGYGDALESGDSDAFDAIDVHVAAMVDRRTEAIFLSALREALGRHRVDALLAAIAELEDFEIDEDMSSASFEVPLEVVYAYGNDRDDSRSPSAVQQSVPAWLVFAIFFIAIPFSNTFIAERTLGVHRRLATTAMRTVDQFVGKITPYFLINVVQAILMVGVGVYLVPLIGGQALEIGGSLPALLVMAAGVSFAALSLAMLISVLADTTEQATLASGLGNIILAAIGGIMVPRFVMPPAMQEFSSLSPMAWGLDGFLDVLLHGGGFADIANDFARLCVFGAVMLGIAAVAFRRRA